MILVMAVICCSGGAQSWGVFGVGWLSFAPSLSPLSSLSPFLPCRVQLGACLMIHVLIAWGSQVLLTMLARLAAGKVGALGAWSSGPQGVGSTLPSFKRPVWILEPRARRQAKEKKDV